MYEAASGTSFGLLPMMLFSTSRPGQREMRVG
jgi:hypothetical protein